MPDFPQDISEPRPATRGECVGGARPCPFVSCRHNLFLDIAEGGALKFTHDEGVEPWDVTESCALDVADRGGATLEEVGAIYQLTRERIRQIEVAALFKLKLNCARCGHTRALHEDPCEGDSDTCECPGFESVG